MMRGFALGMMLVGGLAFKAIDPLFTWVEMSAVWLMVSAIAVTFWVCLDKTERKKVS